MQKIPSNDISRRVNSTTIREVNDRFVGIGVRIRCYRIGRIDADVMTGKAFDQFALGCHRPLFSTCAANQSAYANMKSATSVLPNSLAHSAVQTRAAITTARVEDEYPAFSSQRSCAVTGPCAIKRAAARKIIARGLNKSSASCLCSRHASSIGKATWSSCNPDQ